MAQKQRGSVGRGFIVSVAALTLAVLSISFAQTTFAQTQTSDLRFLPVTPCRIADTRLANGPFGGPSLSGQTVRGFTIPSSACSIPGTAQAYSLNVTVVPHGPLGFLTTFPCGQTQPLVSTLNSDGRIKAVAAIVPAGTNGDVCFFVTNDTDVVLDIDGYFVPSATPSSLSFYPVTPCRLVDTRLAAGALGGPSLVGNAVRTFPILSGPCNLPGTSQAYSLNYTSVPKGGLSFLTTWPTGQPQPLVSTLNAPTGAVTANAAIVPAGANGAVSVFVTNDSDLVIDVNGYFAPPGSGGLSLFNLSPCRVLDTRNPSGSPPLNGAMNVNVMASGCGASGSAQSYVLNATVVPPSQLGFLTLWPQGGTQPLVSTLNAGDGAVTSNMALVPAANGSVSAFAANPSHLVLDISGYFAPPVGPPPPDISVTVTPTSAQVIAGDNRAFTATVTGSSDTTVDWSVQEGASGGSIGLTGLYTAGFSSGVFHVIARSKVDPSKTATATITVPIEDPALSDVSPSVVLMGTGPVTASITGDNFFPTSVVQFDGSEVATTYVSQAKLSALIPASNTANASFNSIAVANPTLGGGISPSRGFRVVDPSHIVLVINPDNISVTTGTSKTLVATVTGTPDSTVSWSVNGVVGGNSTAGTITADGVYTAPANLPSPQHVSVTATSSFDTQKSATITAAITAVLESKNQTITASAGGTIQLPSGSTVTVPPGAFSQDCDGTLQLTSASAQPINNLFAGIGPSLIFTCPVFNSSQGTSNSISSLGSTSSSTPITFILQGGQAGDSALQNAIGLADVNTGTDNYFGAQLSVNSGQNQTTIQFDSKVIAQNSTVQIGVARISAGAVSTSGDAVLQVWKEVLGQGPAFINTGGSFCPTGRTLIMIHGMLSSPQDAFGALAADQSIAPSGPYETVLGIKYEWFRKVPISAPSIATLVNSLFDGPCNMSSEFDIEAHSEGTVVALASLPDMSPGARSKLQHLILVAGPLNGTPFADNAVNIADNIVSYFANKNTVISLLKDILMPINKGDIYSFVSDLRTNSAIVSDAQAGASQAAKSIEIIVVGGDNPDPPAWVKTVTGDIFGSAPNDGVVPISSSLPADSFIPNVVRLGPYNLGHSHLVNDPTVISDILAAVNGRGATSQIGLSTSPSSASVKSGDIISISANVIGMLNPVINWKTSGGVLENTVGVSVNFTAPQASGTYIVTAQSAALPNVTALTNIVVGGAPTAGPTISDFTWNPTPQSNRPFSGTITGTGFASSTQVFFCLTSSNTCFQHPSAGVTVNNPSTLSVVNVQLSNGSWQFYVQTSAGRSTRSAPFTVQEIEPTPTISGYTWDSTPGANQLFSGTIRGTGLVAPLQVFFCFSVSTTCFQHPSAGVTINDASNLSVANVQLGSGSYQIYVHTSAGQSARSTSFTVGSAAVPTISGYTWISTPIANQPFSGTITGSGFLSNIQVFFCVNLSSTCYQQPSAGVTVNSATTLNVSNVNLSGGSWQLYLESSTGQSARSTAFTVQSVTLSTSGLTTSPNPIVLGTQFNFTITGTNFDPSTAQVYVTGPNCPSSTSCVIPTNVMSSKTSTSITGPATIFNNGAFSFFVQNSPGGTPSNPQTLTVLAVPTTNSLSTSPNPTVLGSQFSFTISGTNFDPLTAQVYVTGPGCPSSTSCVIPTNVMTFKTNSTIVGPATIPNPGTFSFFVQNGSGGTPSNAQTLVVSGGAPTTNGMTISANPVVLGSQFNFTITGNNFNPSTAQVYVTGPNCPSSTSCVIPTNVMSSKSSTSITGPVTIFNNGAFSFFVQNGPGGTPSNSQTLTVAAVPTTSSMSTSPNPIVRGSQFSFTISGTNFDPSTAQVYVTGPGCPTSTSCVIPTNVMTFKTNTTIVGPATISSPGTFSFFVQDGSNGVASNAQVLVVH
jgi:hypothetical protein